MIDYLFIFIVAMFMVIRGATMATKYAARLAESFHLSKYAVGFIVIAVISILPETLISINAAVSGIPSFGLGMLFGSNVADLTLVIAAIVMLAGRSLKVESVVIRNHAVYPFILILPLVLGFNGHLSRLEGIALIISGGVFYYLALKNGADRTVLPTYSTSKLKSSFMLIVSMALLLVGSHFVVSSASSLAGYFGVNPILIGILFVGLGTTMPEFLFSLASVKKQDDSLAVGDILGTVLADATIVAGTIAIINPFSFPPNVVYVTGMFMVAASVLLFRVMRSGRAITKSEARLLLAFWAAFVLIEFIANG